MTLRDLALNTARLLSRPKGETADSDHLLIAKCLLFASFVAALALVFVPLAISSFIQWDHFHPEVRLSKWTWLAYYKNGGPCGRIAAKDCPANPSNPELWNSYFHRANPEHKIHIRERRSNTYWIGTEIPVETLEEARKRGAYELLLGRIRAPYRIWVDGQYYFGRSGTDASQPTAILIPPPRFQVAKPLSIAVKIYHDDDFYPPDILNDKFGGEGFVTPASQTAHAQIWNFRNNAKPLALVFADALICCLFFGFWLSNRRRGEYFYMTIFAMASALRQARKLGVVISTYNIMTLHRIDTFIEFYLGVSCMLLGLAFARTRRSVFTWLTPVLVLAPLALNHWIPDYMRRDLNASLRAYLLPACSFIGALACFIQLYFLRNERAKGSYLPVRMRELRKFGVGLVGLGIFHYAYRADLVEKGGLRMWLGFDQLPFLLFLGGIVLREYRQRELLATKTPVSEYHQRPQLPERVTGALLVADLKASEPFYKFRASHDSENLVSTWRSQLYTVILKHGGTVIHKKGDEIIAFFDRDKCDSPALSAIHATDEMNLISQLLEIQFRLKNSFPPDAKGFHFRAALTLGSIKPVWETMGGVREPYWEEAGDSTPFVEASRLLEFERKCASSTDSNSLLVLRDELRESLLVEERRLASRFCETSRKFSDKHGTEYQLSIYAPPEKAATRSELLSAA